MRKLYWTNSAFKDCTNFDHIKTHYYWSHPMVGPKPWFSMSFRCDLLMFRLTLIVSCQSAPFQMSCRCSNKRHQFHRNVLFYTKKYLFIIVGDYRTFNGKFSTSRPQPATSELCSCWNCGQKALWCDGYTYSVKCGNCHRQKRRSEPDAEIGLNYAYIRALWKPHWQWQ